MKDKAPYVFDLREADRHRLALAGGKAANLGELFKIEGLHVPGGFCVSTEAFKKMMAQTPLLNALLEQLSLLEGAQTDEIRKLSGSIRQAIEETEILQDIEAGICEQLARFGETKFYAVRSSATAEDLPGASFAGQQDTYLNITGQAAILQHISKCWASLFTERAIVYRLQNGFDHRQVSLAVIVQEMVFPQASGILFTADPVTSNRKVVSIDAGFGLGEALVSGLVNADVYKLRHGQVADKKIPVKKLAVYAVPGGGTVQREIEPGLQSKQVLTDEQIVELEHIGRTIEAHFGAPQDIEWCLADAVFYIVQSRPITTLFPVPKADDDKKHLYISVGHQQMMTDAMTPFGLSLWQLTAARPMYEAAGRLYVDVADQVATQAGYESLLNAMGQHDPLIKDALVAIIERGDFIRPLAGDKQDTPGILPLTSPPSAATDPAMVAELIANSEASLKILKQQIGDKSGVALFDFILEDQQQFRQSRLDPRSMAAIMASMNALFWLNAHMMQWLGEQNVADTLSQSAPNNITSEMGLALLDVADAIRPYPEVISYLHQTKSSQFLDELTRLKGGPEAREAISAFLDAYGMRGAGEIDITRPRWAERPEILLPLILGNIRNFTPGESRRRFEQGLQAAMSEEQDLLERLKQLPGGEQKAAQTKGMIDQLRNFAGYREYPKYFIVSRSFVYKQAMMKEVEKLVKAGVLHETGDAGYLRFEELREAVRNQQVDQALIAQRKAQHGLNQKLAPPRVITSEGEVGTGAYSHASLPARAIAGLGVSSGTIDGRARVIHSMEEASLEEGDILVTAFTDPSWTPLFVLVKGLVTEVGGMMTHGAVIAREYGLPAVVGVEHATQLIKDGQQIRVNGAEGYVELL